MVTRVSVIGGGIGGLSAAIAFRQIGLDVKVYEQSPALGEVGAGITLWPNAIRVLRKLNLAEQVVEKGSVIHRAAFLTWNGKMLSSSNQDELNNFAGEPTVAIHRADLHRILVQALPAETLILNSHCRAVAESGDAVRAEFDDGREETADLVVAADGIHSAIRKQLFPAAELRYAGYSAWRGIAHTSRELAQGITSESLGCGSRFGIVPIDANRVYWFATANSPAGTSSNIEERKEKLLQRFKGWHYPIEELINLTRPEDILKNDIYDIAPMDRWYSGRTVLLGDAIHPTTPNMGQGACMAIESGFVLAKCLNEIESLPAALERYQALRRPRTASITQQSRLAGRIGQVQSPIACAARNLLLRLMPSRMVMHSLKQVVAFDPNVPTRNAGN